MVMGMPSAVMDLPTPRDISMVFVKQYYTLLNEAPDHVHRFYSQNSSFVHGGLERGKKSETKTAQGQKEINDRIQKLQFKDARTKIKQVDAHPTLAGGVVIQVSGQLSNNGAPMRPFMQTFVLAPQTTHNYYVYNDIFRYQDDLFSDDEETGDGAAEADDEAEPESPPAPAPQPPAPAAAPEPAAAAAAPPPPPPAAAAYGPTSHVNGHGASPGGPPPAPERPAEPTPPQSPPPPAAPAAPESQEPEPAAQPPPPPPAASPQPPRQPSPQPPRQPTPPPVSNEPKTYANVLFKASSNRPAAPRPADKDQSPPSRSAAAATTAARPAPAPASAPRPAPPAGRSDLAESGVGAGTGTGGGPAGDSGERRRPLLSHPDSHQIFVGNLPQDITNAELIEHFTPFGEVVDIKIYSSKPPLKGVPPRTYPNYGFVIFDSPGAVVRVLQDMPVKLSRQGYDEDHRLNIEKKQQRPGPGEGRGRGERPGGPGRGSYSRGAPRGRGGYGRGEGRGGGRGGYQSGPRR